MATQTQERNGQVQTQEQSAEISPAMKLRAEMMKSLGAAEIINRLQELIKAISEADSRIGEAKVNVGGANANLELADARLVLEAEGKNAEERKADVVRRKRADKEYMQMEQAVQTCQIALEEAQRDKAALEREFGLLQRLLAFKTAQLQFMAGAE